MKSFNFKSFIKKIILYFAVFGLLIGLFLFVLSFFTDQVTADFFGKKYKGMVAGFISLVMVPFYSSVIGLVFSVVLYIPIKAIQKK